MRRRSHLQSHRPISAFSAASAAARSAGAANAFGALVPQGESVAEQPVYTTRDGSLIATVRSPSFPLPS